MGRKPRLKAVSGIYHVIIRGVNQQDIFLDDEDRMYMLKILGFQQERQEKVGQQEFNQTENVIHHHSFSLYSWCLMSNHVHLLMRTFEDQLSDIMKRMEDTYARHFNDRWGRSGHLFQNRFKSEPVEDRQYFLTLIHYINYNPVKAGITARATDYLWSSARELADLEFTEARLCSMPAILQAISKDDLADMMQNDCNFNGMEFEDRHIFTDDELWQLISRICGAQNLTEFQRLDSLDQMLAATRLVQDEVPISRITRMTGVSRYMIHHFLQKVSDTN